jgi:hypothetical protein
MSIDPITIVHDTTLNDWQPFFHVLSGASVTAGGETSDAVFYLEPLAQLKLYGCPGCLVYMKSGATISEMDPIYFDRMQVVYEPGAFVGVSDSVLALRNHFLPCDNVTFGTTGVHEVIPGPGSLELSASPNPFHATTMLHVMSGAQHGGTLRIYNTLGSCVAIHTVGATSSTDIAWDGTSSDDHPLPTGLYRAVVTQGTQVAQSNLLLVR